MAMNRVLPSRRREDIRAWWGEHLAAERESGQIQAACCGEQGVDTKYFTLWRGNGYTQMTGARCIVPMVVSVRGHMGEWQVSRGLSMYMMPDDEELSERVGD